MVSLTLFALHPLYQMANYVSNEEVLKKANLPSIESILLQVQLRWAGQVSMTEDIRMPKAVFSSELQEGKRDRGAPRKRYKDQLSRQLAQARISHQTWPQTETAGAHQWEKPVVSSRQRDMNSQRKDAGGRKSVQHPNHPQPKPSRVHSVEV